MNPRKLLAQLRKLYSRLGKSERLPLPERNKILIACVALMDAVVRLAVVQFRNQLPPNTSKLFDVAGKCRARALGTPSENEKEVSLRMCLTKMQGIIPMLTPPNIEDYLKRLDTREKAYLLRMQAKSAKAAARASGAKVPRAPRTPAGQQPVNTFGVRRKYSPVPQILSADSNLIVAMSQLAATPFRKGSAKQRAFQYWWEDFRTKEQVAQFLNQATNGKGKSLVWVLWNKRNGGDESMHWSFIQQGKDKFKLVVCDINKYQPKP